MLTPPKYLRPPASRVTAIADAGRTLERTHDRSRPWRLQSIPVPVSRPACTIWEFTHSGQDSVAYFLGENSTWTARFQGTVRPVAGGKYTFQPGPQNGNVGMPANFTVTNAAPEAAPPVANKRGSDWR